MTKLTMRPLMKEVMPCKKNYLPSLETLNPPLTACHAGFGSESGDWLRVIKGCHPGCLDSNGVVFFRMEQEMASRENRAALTIIATAHGAIRVLLSEKRFSRLDMQEDLEKLNIYCQRVRDGWPGKYKTRDLQWIQEKMQNWGEYIDERIRGDELQTKVLVKIGTMAAGDLLDKLKNPPEKRKIQRLYSGMERIDGFTDAQGTAFLSLEQADAILQRLYKEIGFSA